MQVCIETMEGTRFIVHARQSNKVGYLKECIYAIDDNSTNKNSPLEQHSLQLGGQELQDEWTLGSCNVPNHARLQLRPRPSTRRIAPARTYLQVRNTTTGETIVIDSVERLDTIQDVKEKVRVLTGLSKDQQHLAIAGKSLDNGRLVSDYPMIVSGSTLHLTVQPEPQGSKGMISTFAMEDFRNPLIQYLMQSDEYRIKRTLPLEALYARAKACGAKPNATYVYNGNCNILAPDQRQRLCSFLKFMWHRTADASRPEGTAVPSRRVDLRLVIQDAELIQVMMMMPSNKISCSKREHSKAIASVVKLEKSYYNVPGTNRSCSPKIVLRMTRGPTLSCINFHCDNVMNATSTSQIPLNPEHEYKGGRLCFFVNGQIQFPPRTPGSLTQHPPQVLHAVTSVTHGTRMSLFVIDRANGANENDEAGVFTVSSQDVTAWLDSKPRMESSTRSNKRPLASVASNPSVAATTRTLVPEPKPEERSCVVCLDAPADHVLLPCGHVCLCKSCRVRACPLCRAKVSTKHRIFL